MAKITINYDDTNTAVSQYNKNSNDINDAKATFESDFACTSFLLGNTISSISETMSTLSLMINGMSGVISSQAKENSSYDLEMASKAEQIEIPDDFLAENSMEVNEYNKILLSLMDGKSVNEGEDAKGFNEIDDPNVNAAALSDISGDTTQQQKYDDSTVVGETLLGNINGNVTEAQEYDDKSGVKGELLENINGNQTQQQKYDDSTGIKENVLSDISGNTTQQQEYDDSTGIKQNVLSDISGNVTQQQEYDSTSVVQKEQLTDIGGNVTQQQEYDGNSTIVGETLLGNINGSVTQEQSYDDSNVVAAVQDEKTKNEVEEGKGR